MLQNLSAEIRECLEHAETCKGLAARAHTESERAEYERMQTSWYTLANSYAFTESLSHFVPSKQRERVCKSIR